MTLSEIKNVRKDRGFTIVELLIVIVVIGILAAITIVAYNGITQRANSANAQSAANTAIKKLEAYNADTSTATYPAYPSLLTAAAATTTYQLTGVSFSSAATAPITAPASPTVLNFYSCATGARVDYYKYDGTAAWTAVYTGGASGTTTCTYKPSTATS